jgi:hypothetical protein
MLGSFRFAGDAVLDQFSDEEELTTKYAKEAKERSVGSKR